MALITRLATQFTGTDNFDRIVYSLPVAGATSRFLASDLPVGNITSWPSKIGTASFGAAVGSTNRRAQIVDGRTETLITGDGLIMTGYPTTQPFTLTMYVKFAANPVSNKVVIDGGPVSFRRLTTGALQPVVNSVALTAMGVVSNNGTWQSVIFQINGASSVLSLDSTEITFDAAAHVPNHLYMGVSGGDTFSVREQVIYPFAMTSQQRIDARKAMAAGLS